MWPTKKKLLSIKVDVKNRRNEIVKQISLNTLEEVQVEKIAKVVKWQQSNARVGTHNTKDVSELAYSTRKLRKQKGGGCARFRNKGAVQFRGGATIFGPDGRLYDYKINKKERQLGLQHALSLKIQKKEFFIIENLQFENSTVKEFFHFKKIHNIDSNSVLLIDNEKNQMVLKAIGNIHEANFLPIIGINVLSVIQNKFVICTEKALTVLQERGIL